jgi:hypothetical protein
VKRVEYWRATFETLSRERFTPGGFDPIVVGASGREWGVATVEFG